VLWIRQRGWIFPVWEETRWRVFFKQYRILISICVANILAPTVLEEKATDTFEKRVVAFVIGMG